MDQQEGDQLLGCASKEMQTAAQNDRHSPRSASESTSSHQPKMKCDVKHNSSLPIKGKGRKREKIVHNLGSCKRERLMKITDSDPGQGHLVKPDEITNMIDKDGGLLNLSSVDKLVHLMQQDCNTGAKKTHESTSWRITLVHVIASTEKAECLNRFVQLGGLPMLNDWLQEAHKGKDGESPKDGDKGVEELLMTLLQALDKLPVDLDALKKCIVGKSVNNLRSHRNSEIQKRARKLVDTWKKRVDAEMKLSESVLGSDPSGNPAETSEMASKGLTVVKEAADDFMVDDSVTKDASGVVDDNKSHALSSGVNDHLLKDHSYGSAEIPLKEDKNSNSNQSQNNSLSCYSSPLNGNSSSSKEGAKLSSSVSIGGKAHESVTSGKGDSSGSLAAQKDSVSKSLILGQVTAHEKNEYFGTAEKGSTENVRTENINNQKLIVRLPNPGRGFYCTVTGGSIADVTNSKVLNTFEMDGTLVNDGSSEIGSGDEKGRSLFVNPLDYTECKNVDFENTSINSKNGIHDEKKEVCTINVSASVDLHASGFGYSSVDGNEVDTSQLRDEERRKDDDGIDDKNCSGNSGNIGRVEESPENFSMDASRLNMHKIKASNMNAMVVEETKEGRDEQELSGFLLAAESCAAAMEADCIGVAEKHMSEQEGVIAENILNNETDVDDQRQSQNNIDSHIENDGSSEESFDGVACIDAKTTAVPNIASMTDALRSVGAACRSCREGAEEGKAKQYDKTGPQASSPVTSECEDILAQQADTMFKVGGSDKCLLGAAHPNHSQGTVTERGEAMDAERTHEAVAGIKDDHVLSSGTAEKVKLAVENLLDRSIDGPKIEGIITSVEEGCTFLDCMLPERASQISTYETIATRGPDLRNVEPAVGTESYSRPLFDLNEGAVLDEPVTCDAMLLTALRSPALLPANFLAAPVAVVATSKGLFIPSLDSMQCRTELGWKGSAATSAFRPAEPRHTQESAIRSNCTLVKNAKGEEGEKQIHALDIDLNIADEKVLEDLNADTLQGPSSHLNVQASSSFKTKARGEVLTFANGAARPELHLQMSTGDADYFSTAARPELDLNLANETEGGLASLASEITCNKAINSDSFYPAVCKFDLNSGPSLEDVVANESAAEYAASNLPGLRINLEGNLASFFPSVQSLSSEATLPFTAPKAGPLHPAISAASANEFLRTGSDSHPFNQEPYARCAPIPAYSWSSKGDFPCTDFTLTSDSCLTSGTPATNMRSYVGPSPSTAFPTVPSELVGTRAVVSPCIFPYLSGIPKALANESYAAITRPDLDLNAGPELACKDARSEVILSRQPHSFGHLSFSESGITGLGHANLMEPGSSTDPFRPGLQWLTRQ